MSFIFISLCFTKQHLRSLGVADERVSVSVSVSHTLVSHISVCLWQSNQACRWTYNVSAIVEPEAIVDYYC